MSSSDEHEELGISDDSQSDDDDVIASPVPLSNSVHKLTASVSDDESAHLVALTDPEDDGRGGNSVISPRVPPAAEHAADARKLMFQRAAAAARRGPLNDAAEAGGSHLTIVTDEVDRLPSRDAGGQISLNEHKSGDERGGAAPRGAQKHKGMPAPGTGVRFRMAAKLQKAFRGHRDRVTAKQLRGIRKRTGRIASGIATEGRDLLQIHGGVPSLCRDAILHKRYTHFRYSLDGHTSPASSPTFGLRPGSPTNGYYHSDAAAEAVVVDPENCAFFGTLPALYDRVLRPVEFVERTSSTIGLGGAGCAEGCAYFTGAKPAGERSLPCVTQVYEYDPEAIVATRHIMPYYCAPLSPKEVDADEKIVKQYLDDADEMRTQKEAEAEEGGGVAGWFSACCGGGGRDDDDEKEAMLQNVGTLKKKKKKTARAGKARGRKSKTAIS